MVFAGVLGGLIVRNVLRGEVDTRQAAEEQSMHIAPAPLGPQAELAGPMQDARINLVDRRDASRTLGELHLEQIEPMEERHYYLVTDPRGFVYLEDGRTIFIRSDRGRLYIPDGAVDPESGLIEGNVVIQFYEARGDGKAIDVEHDTPRGTLRTESLYFDRVVGELSTTAEVTVHASELEANIRGLTAIINEHRERLERLETLSDGRLVYRPGVRTAKQLPPPAPVVQTPRPAPPAGEAPRPAPEPPPPPVEAFYSMTVRDEVVLTQQGRRISSDLLSAWVRTIDGELPENAIGAIRVAGQAPGQAPGRAAEDGRQAQVPAESGTKAPVPQQRSPEKQAEARDSAGAGEYAAPVAAAATADKDADDAIRMNWSGPAVLMPIERAPDELERDHLALRFTSEAPGAVEFSDQESGSRGQMSELDYRATTRRMTFAGPGSDGARVVLPGSGGLESGRIEGDLGTGLVKAIGPSALVPDGGERFRITAADGASFSLAKRDGAITAELEEAIFERDVRMESTDGSAAADFARAHFVTTAERANNLVVLVLEGQARMETSQGDWLRGDVLDVRFRPSIERAQPEPTQLIGRGSVQAGRRGEGDHGPETMSAQMLDATLTRNEGGRIEVGEAVLREAVEIVRDQSRISGEDVRIEPGRRTLHVRSAGEFQHADGESKLTARWTREMSFDDLAGVLDCEGDVRAESRADAHSTDRMEAERLIAHMTPAGSDGENREVLRILAVGDDESRASVESRRYGQEMEQHERRLEQVMYLEGMHIEADNQRGTMDVPTSGRLVLLDHRPEADAARDGTAPEPDARSDLAGRGSMLLDWDGWLKMNRASGEAELERNVRATHRRLADGKVTNLATDHLTAQFSPQGDFAAAADLTPAAQMERVQLLSALARGSVHISSGPASEPGVMPPLVTELSADEVAYDAVANVVEASAFEGNVVTLFHPGTPTPTTARSIWWNLITDDVRILEPAPMVIPR